MTINKNTIAVGAVALLVGIGIGYALPSHKYWGRYADEKPMHTAMHSMTVGLDGKTGDAFDKAFLEEMIVHHEGAVTMANLVLQKAKHEELRTLATAIIDAQTKEITQMKAWLTKWYGAE